MTPYYADDWLTVYQGDCREVMASMEPESVHCVVTSPPYWGLRDYGTATWIGGAVDCDHRPNAPSRASTVAFPPSRPPAGRVAGTVTRGDCGRCGAHRQDAQLGLDPTPEAYVANMVAVFREVRRVLRADGTVWLNLGDSYHGGGSTTRNGQDTSLYLDKSNIAGTYTEGMTGRPVKSRDYPGYKPKDLVGIPWRVAFALQADGWYLRSDIIWAKPNPMPESVTDRPTKAHEYLFLLTKSARYFYDNEAVREPGEYVGVGLTKAERLRNTPELATGVSPAAISQRGPTAMLGDPAGRNLRSVWTVATQPYPGAHFATFPPKLVEPCIKAGSPRDGTVLDPFGGSGTTGMVAQSLSRRAVLIDLNADYLVQAMKRNVDVPLGLDVA